MISRSKKIINYKLSLRYSVPSVFILAFVLVYILFGNILLTLNTTHFSASGDGLKSYYSAIYHAKHDSTYFHTRAMNYPYGENVFFTDGQPLLSNFVKAVSYIIDISSYTVGLMNFLMLFSIVLGAVFLFLIFTELKLPTLYSTVVSLAIAFLSPQIGRMGGHFSLSYIFAIPALIWLLMVFSRKPRWWLSIIISFYVFLISGFHFYYFGFFGFLLVFFWGYFIFFDSKRTFKNVYIKLLHLTIQLIVPFVVLQILTNIGSDVNDRTTHPWGFMYYRAYPEGVFLPFMRPYGQWLNNLMTFKHVNWESWVYIGLVSSIATLVFFILMIVKLIQRKFSQILPVTQNPVIDISFWAGVAALLFSFGFPFIIKMEWLLDYTGPIRQLRGVARFSWVFFYVINIAVFYHIYTIELNNKWQKIKYIAATLALLMLVFDATQNAKGIDEQVDNHIEQLNEKTDNYAWITDSVAQRYQAIMSVPYFHVGSENIWKDAECGILKPSFFVSLHSSLPLMGSLMSRTSVSQTYQNIQVFNEPYRKLETMENCPDEKPFLLIASNNCEKISDSEQNMIDTAKQIAQKKDFTIYEISYSYFIGREKRIKNSISNEIEQPELYQQEKLMTTDSIKNYYYNDFYGNLSNNAYMGVDAYEGIIGKDNVIFDHTINNYDTTRQYVASFWFGGIKTDRYARTMVHFIALDKDGNEYQNEYFEVGKLFKIIDGNWALVEYNFKLKSATDRFKIVLFMRELGSHKMFIDELMIRPVDNNLYIELPEYIGKNNRYFPIVE